jgi:ankyrin repeat protein
MIISNEQYTQLINTLKAHPDFVIEDLNFIILTEHLQKYMDIDKKSQEGSTALHYTLYLKNAEAALIILQWGANINILNSNGYSPFKLLLNYISTYALDYKSKFYSSDLKNFNYYYNLIEHFIIKGANINEVNFSFQSILHIAASFRKNSLINLLLEKDINLEQKDIEGYTALDRSIHFQSLEAFKLLLLKGAKFTKETLDNLYDQPKIYDFYYNYKKFIQNNYIRLNQQDEEGNTNLHVALEKKNYNSAKDLIINGASLAIPNNNGIRPIDLINNIIKNIFFYPDKLFTVNKPFLLIKSLICESKSIAKFKLYIDPLINKYIANKILSEDGLNKLKEVLKAKNDELGTSGCKSYKDYYGENWYKILEVCKDISPKTQGSLVINSLPKELLKEIGVFVYYDSEYYQYEKILEPIVNNNYHQTTLLGTESIE